MNERNIHPQDQDALTELWLAHRLATDVKIYPTIWRYRLLLSSRVWDQKQDTRIWQAEDEKLLAVGMLWSRQPSSPYRVLELCIDPCRATAQVFRAGLLWGLQRTRAIACENWLGITLFASAINHLDASEHFRALGLEAVPPDEREHNLYFVRSLKSEIEESPIPEGCTIRLLQHPSELEAYNAIYDFTTVNPQHLKELLGSDEYHHHVLEIANGELVAYCETSFSRAEWQPSGQHLGWIDYIGTRPEDQRRGFGRSILLESLRHLQAQGAENAILVTVSSNTPAIALYRHAGFEIAQVSEPARYQIHLLPEQQA